MDLAHAHIVLSCEETIHSPICSSASSSSLSSRGLTLDAQSLLCCEEMIMNTPSMCSSASSEELSCPNSSPGFSSSYGVMPAHHDGVGDAAENVDLIGIQSLLEKQLHCAVLKQYAPTLLRSTQMCRERQRVVQWMIKVQSAFHFSPTTAALAVSYFDRYLSRNLALSWKEWMFELLSLACVSLAAKMEEVEVPTLLDLQIDGLQHSFHGATIQRMELAVMNGLEWKLQPVTPFAFVDEAIRTLDVGIHMKNSLLERIAELLLGTLSYVEFVSFEPSAIAMSLIFCALEESMPIRAHTLKAWLLKQFLMSEESTVMVSKCSSLLEELVVDPVSSSSYLHLLDEEEVAARASPTSPTGVLALDAAHAKAARICTSLNGVGQQKRRHGGGDDDDDDDGDVDDVGVHVGQLGRCDEKEEASSHTSEEHGPKRQRSFQE